MLEAIQSAYAFFEQLHISVTGLVVAIVLFALAFLFAIREAASWFFKVDDLKRDIGRLKEISLQLESEVRLIQGLVNQATQAMQQSQANTSSTPHAPMQTFTPVETPPQPVAQPQAEAPTHVAPSPVAVAASSDVVTPTPLFSVSEPGTGPSTISASEAEKISTHSKSGAFPVVF